MIGPRRFDGPGGAERPDPAAKGAGNDTAETAMAALFISIFWLFGIGSLVGIYLARRCLRAIDRSDGETGGRTIAWVALAVGVAGLFSLTLVIAFVIASAK